MATKLKPRRCSVSGIRVDRRNSRPAAFAMPELNVLSAGTGVHGEIRRPTSPTGFAQDELRYMLAPTHLFQNLADDTLTISEQPSDKEALPPCVAWDRFLLGHGCLAAAGCIWNGQIWRVPALRFP